MDLFEKLRTSDGIQSLPIYFDIEGSCIGTTEITIECTKKWRTSGLQGLSNHFDRECSSVGMLDCSTFLRIGRAVMVLMAGMKIIETD